ncbi:MAG: hypothetical protein R3B82_19045 [Sandaracinaceae bacterium]
MVFADEGLAIMMHGLSVLATVDAELEETLGERRYATLRRALGDVVARLEEG